MKLHGSSQQIFSIISYFKYVGNFNCLCFDRLSMRIEAVFALSLSKGIMRTKCADVLILNYFILYPSYFILSFFLLFLAIFQKKKTTMIPFAAPRSIVPTGILPTGIVSPTTAKNSVLGMVIMRINHDMQTAPEPERSSISFSTEMMSEGTWNVAMNAQTTSPELLSALTKPNNNLQVMELWNEQIPSTDKHVFLQELGNVLQQNILQSNSSVLTHNFCILNTKNGYHSFQWICSILPDKFGNTSRITASLRVLSPQVHPLH
jgi:hypothetical protein